MKTTVSPRGDLGLEGLQHDVGLRTCFTGAFAWMNGFEMNIRLMQTRLVRLIRRFSIHLNLINLFKMLLSLFGQPKKG